MWLYAKVAIAVCLSILLVVGGWKANGWRIRAAEASLARAELRHEQERRVKSDADRLALQIKLSAAEARIGTGVRVVTKTIRQYVKDLPDCRIAGPAADGLRSLRAGNVPAAPSQPSGARAAP